MTKRLIQQLTSVTGMKVECPNCGEAFSLSRAKLFSMYESYPPAAQRLMSARREIAIELIDDAKERGKQLALDRKRKPQKITISTQATNYGQHCEQIVPAFTSFPYTQGDCRILFKPIDYIVFEGIGAKGRVEAVKFVEFKTGGGTLGLKQRQIRDCISVGRVTHEVIEK